MADRLVATLEGVHVLQQVYEETGDMDAAVAAALAADDAATARWDAEAEAKREADELRLRLLRARARAAEADGEEERTT